jgi:hypothetical protein
MLRMREKISRAAAYAALALHVGDLVDVEDRARNVFFEYSVRAFLSRQACARRRR